jgi:hypothetical protein
LSEPHHLNTKQETTVAAARATVTYDMNVGCSLKDSTASTIAKWYCLYTYIT